MAAAVAFRIVTAIHDKSRAGAEGLVRWAPAETAAAAARRQRKPILYDFTAAWCPPCHRLDSDGWGDSAIAETVNRSYLPARIVDRQREDGKNPAAVEELERRYSINAFPTLIVTTAEGVEIGRAEGYRGKEWLVRFLEETRAKATPKP